ncbi:MAG: SAM-dependent methyltransferase [Pseudomonadota bacterium]|jgi:23S rRNA C2498 (ribose-2'-O)-methylase RlmM
MTDTLFHNSHQAFASPQLVTTCITRAGQEQYLCQEISHSVTHGYRTSPVQCTQTEPQTIVLTHHSHEDLCALPIFFSAQCLPNSQPIHADSITSWANCILQALIEAFGEASPPWLIHIFDCSSVETGKQYARAQRIQEALNELLKRKRRSYLRTLQLAPTPPCHLVQVVLSAPTRGFISISDRHIRTTYKTALASTLAGYHPIPDDKRPPSRAFKKLLEAIDVFALAPSKGETAVDLGASPGGWTYVLRQLGLVVTAIDRSPLAESLQRDQGISWLAGNALTWQPPKPVDWLVCDVITTPDNTAQLLTKWLSEGWCRNFCITVKFKGHPEIDTLLSLANFLRSNTSWLDARQLTHNKNELTIVGSK